MLTQSPILIQQMSYTLPNNKTILSNLNLAFASHKTGLIGRNGSGKSTLLKLICGELRPSSGSIQLENKMAYVPQDPIIDAKVTVAAFLGFAEKIQALHRIYAGSVAEHDFITLNEEWDIEAQLQKQLALFGLDEIQFDRLLASLSGGELTRLLLIKAFHSDADFLLLDEPTNHLDVNARQHLYSALKQWQQGLIIISHDRKLLNFMDEIVELSSLGAKCYGGNYEAYFSQKKIETEAALQMVQARKEIVEKSKTVFQIRKERHEQNEAKGRRAKKEQIKAKGSYDKIAFKSAKGRSEQTNRRIRLQGERKIENVESQLQAAKDKVEIVEEIKVDLPATKVPQGKIILEIDNVTFGYATPLIKNFNFKLQGPEHVAIVGSNGSGKTTLVNLILGKFVSSEGHIYLGTSYVSYLDQHASLLNPEISVLENFLQFNPETSEFEAYRSLASFLFKNIAALKLVKDLSGGEKLRALLACVLMSKTPPQLLILDEPTNHLDIFSVEQIESALKNYQGAMLVISHDEKFLENIQIGRVIRAPFSNE